MKEGVERPQEPVTPKHVRPHGPHAVELVGDLVAVPIAEPEVGDHELLPVDLVG